MLPHDSRLYSLTAAELSLLAVVSDGGYRKWQVIRVGRLAFPVAESNRIILLPLVAS